MSRRDKALAKLRTLLDGGKYPIGTRLPPERELCTMLCVSRSALREAFEIVEAEGKIWRRVGKGTFVGGRPVKSPRDFFATDSLSSPAEIMEVRLLLEPGIARLAALHATEADIQHMKYCLHKGATAKDEATHERWDRTLHRAVAEAARNNLLSALYDAFSAVRDQTTWGKLGQAIFTASRVREYQKQHRDFVEAIAARLPDKAEYFMRVHLQGVKKNLMRAEDESNDA